ncbi:hypothetical protein EW146_g5874 [Bondarzewia mesenterica]|uniref:Uncharacterized protein n=1 Tax=Bondarzewia mesenterica TaxID=1095465 RepID=A0A4S4LQS0_9AGAM|nr:hypothetical protein EW146_g5874 [Bondarzewia mesenterica]
MMGVRRSNKKKGDNIATTDASKKRSHKDQNGMEQNLRATTRTPLILRPQDPRVSTEKSLSPPRASRVTSLVPHAEEYHPRQLSPSIVQKMNSRTQQFDVPRPSPSHVPSSSMRYRRQTITKTSTDHPPAS